MGHLVPYVAFIIGTRQVACYIGILCAMAAETKLSHTAAMILQAVNGGFVYGFSIMEMTGLPSGTVYPAMRRLERDDLIRSHWEQQSIADAEQRPARKYYKLTRAGKSTLEASRRRYPLLAKLIPAEEVEAL
jgi:PadR family transcriptional regulator, regulatory protein PadR